MIRVARRPTSANVGITAVVMEVTARVGERVRVDHAVRW
jgi:hypothetical protein